MFQATEAALIRAAAYPQDLVLPPWPDLAVGTPEQWRDWLRRMWAVAEFATVITQAAPVLAAQIERILGGVSSTERRLRRVTAAAMRYVLRWTTRATPFGRLAGVAAVRFGQSASVRWGERHREATVPDGRFVAEQVARLERDLTVLRTARVVTNQVGFPRGGTWVVPCGRLSEGRLWDVELKLTDAIRLALQAAVSPVAFPQLVQRLTRMLGGSTAAAEQLLVGLIRAGALLTDVRPPTTVADPAPHLARHALVPIIGDDVAVDVRLDCSVTLPPVVAREAAEAAATLVRVAPHLPGWAEYHEAFLERWGPGAAVPLRKVLQELGFPAGYRGSTRRDPSRFTPRDRLLLELAQSSAMTGGAEIVLDDDLIDRLRGEDDRPPVPHTELRFTLAAQTPGHLDRGQFTLTVISGSRHAAVTAGRFLHLLTPDELAQFRHVYATLPTAIADANLVQLSGPPLEHRLAHLARAPELFPILPIGDFHPDPQWTVADLAVAGDAHRLWLQSLTTNRPVEPLLVNSIMLSNLQQPLVRFLTEIWTAFTAPCTRFDWGSASTLPYLPRVQRGRCVLHQARWLLGAAQLPAAGVAWRQWLAAWQRHRERWRLPRHVLLGDGDTRLRLDLDEHAHLALLRDELNRHGRTVLTEASGSTGWIDDRPAELLITLIRSPNIPPQRHRAAQPGRTITHWPGGPRWLDARLIGPTDHLLIHLAHRAHDLPEGAWFLRYPHPQEHLRLRIPLEDPDRFAEVTQRVAELANRLSEHALLTDCHLAPYRPETRYGDGATLAAAEAVFAADSRAVLAGLRDEGRRSDRQAATAAGMLAIADSFTGDGAAWIGAHVPHRSGPRLHHQQLAQAQQGKCNDELHAALVAYRRMVDEDGLDPDHVLADLLHLHHARMIGVDLNSERHCLRLARAVAHTQLARAAP